MYKVSFTKKKVDSYNGGKVTVVTLHGDLKWSDDTMWMYIPKFIDDWVNSIPNITVTPLDIKVKGKAICNDSDKIDPILGERIAESRAKIRLYKFLKDFWTKLAAYYYVLFFGDDDTPTVDLENRNTVCYNTVVKYTELYNKEKDHLDELLGDMEDEPDTESSPKP